MKKAKVLDIFKTNKNCFISFYKNQFLGDIGKDPFSRIQRISITGKP